MRRFKNCSIGRAAIGDPPSDSHRTLNQARTAGRPAGRWRQGTPPGRWLGPLDGLNQGQSDGHFSGQSAGQVGRQSAGQVGRQSAGQVAGQPPGRSEGQTAAPEPRSPGRAAIAASPDGLVPLGAGVPVLNCRRGRS